MAIFISAGASRRFLIFTTPLFFGSAHAHHAYEKVLHKVPYNVVALSTLFQFAFTTIFGWYVAYLFVRTGSVWPCVATHTFCNAMGVPEWTLDLAWKTRIYRVLLFVGLFGFLVILPHIPAAGTLI
jgi:prenyl protein peptidase